MRECIRAPPLTSATPPARLTASGALLQVLQQLRAEGNKVWYRRLPLSRNRTPDASDLDILHSCAFAAASASDTGVGKDVKFLLVARAAATSTSTSFAAHFLGLVLAALDRGDGASEGGPAAKTRRTDGPAAGDTLNLSVVDNLCRWAPCTELPHAPNPRTRPRRRS